MTRVISIDHAPSGKTSIITTTGDAARIFSQPLVEHFFTDHGQLALPIPAPRDPADEHLPPGMKATAHVEVRPPLDRAEAEQLGELCLNAANHVLDRSQTGLLVYYSDGAVAPGHYGNIIAAA